MPTLSVVMMGASGAVGGEVVNALAEMPAIGRITLLGRRAIAVPATKAQVDQQVIELGDAATYRGLLAGHHAAICTLGVGQPSKVTPEEFIKIDKTAVLSFATECKAAGVVHFELLGAVGAAAASRSRYLRTKGELVDELRALQFTRLSIFQPSMILTPRNRYGVAQAILLKVWPKLDFLLRGGWRKYRGVRVEQLGCAMAKNLLGDGADVELLHYDDFRQLAPAYTRTQ
jgi:uncharacterized protein YbjT (DUF2867 family)